VVARGGGSDDGGGARAVRVVRGSSGGTDGAHYRG
jgi:hypothetical protein